LERGKGGAAGAARRGAALRVSWARGLGTDGVDSMVLEREGTDTRTAERKVLEGQMGGGLVASRSIGDDGPLIWRKPVAASCKKNELSSSSHFCSGEKLVGNARYSFINEQARMMPISLIAMLVVDCVLVRKNIRKGSRHVSCHQLKKQLKFVIGSAFRQVVLMLQFLGIVGRRKISLH
jgi:hypothetical protein